MAPCCTSSPSKRGGTWWRGTRRGSRPAATWSLPSAAADGPAADAFFGLYNDKGSAAALQAFGRGVRVVLRRAAARPARRGGREDVASRLAEGPRSARARRGDDRRRRAGVLGRARRGGFAPGPAGKPSTGDDCIRTRRRRAARRPRGGHAARARRGGVRSDLVVGTSIGAVNGAFVAADPDRAAERLAGLWAGESLGVVFSETMFGRTIRLVRSGTHLHAIEPLHRLLADTLPAEVPLHRPEAAVPLRRRLHRERDGPLVQQRAARRRPSWRRARCPACCPRSRSTAPTTSTAASSTPFRSAAPSRSARAPSTCCRSAGSRARFPSRPALGGGPRLVRDRARHRFHEEMSALPPGVQVHVLPTGGERQPPGLRQFRYRGKNQVSNSIERSYAASAGYLAQVAGPPLTATSQEPPMLPPTPIRRLLLVPLVVLIAGAMAALAPPVALLSRRLQPLRRRTRPGRPGRSQAAAGDHPRARLVDGRDRGADRLPLPVDGQRVRRAAGHRAVPGPPVRDHAAVPQPGLPAARRARAGCA